MGEGGGGAFGGWFSQLREWCAAVARDLVSLGLERMAEIDI